MDYTNRPSINCKTFNVKSDKLKTLILDALQILVALGIPIDDLTERQKEKMAMAFLAVGDVKSSAGWKKIKDSNNTYAVTTREIIDYHNKNFEERISRGSYDDIRRKDLARLVLASIVVNSKPGSNNSNPTRGYRINSEYSRIIRNYGQVDWFAQVEAFNKMHPTYKERISTKRELPKLKVCTSDGKEIFLNDGEHNAIQKQIIEEFLPRFGYGATILYCGDSDNKYGLIFEQDKLTELGFLDLKQNILPDVVAYSSEKDWIYLIEAYHTSNPITPQRKMELSQVMGTSVNKAVFVTAFENNSVYKNCPEELAWETEIWIATEPDHMIHRNGYRFMGPYCEETELLSKKNGKIYPFKIQDTHINRVAESKPQYGKDNVAIKRGSLVKAKELGLGTVVLIKNDFIEVTFPEKFKTIRFPYPECIEKKIIDLIEE